MRLSPIILLALGFLGCRQLTVSEMLAGNRAQSRIQKVETAHHLLTAQYVSSSLLLLSRSGLSGETRVTQELMDSLLRQEGAPSGWTFVLTVSPRMHSRQGSLESDVVYGSKTGFASFQETLIAYQSGMQEKVWLEVEGTRIPPGNYQMENTFGMTNSRNFTFMFPIPRGPEVRKAWLVLDGIVPGMLREKLEFEIPPERYAKSR